MPEQIVKTWLNSFVETASAYDLEGHMAHISKQVQVLGIQGFDSLGYNDWYRQCEEEFPQKMLTSVSYSEPQIQSSDESQILFSTIETLNTKEGKEITQSLEMVLQKNGDNWQLGKLTILSKDQAKQA